MTAVTYVARRSIIPGHSINTTYSINLPVVSMPVNRRVSKSVQESIDLQRETIRFGAAEVWDIQLAVMYGTPVLTVKEFLDSVESGEMFTFDPYGSANTPHNPLTADIESSGYTMTREARGTGGSLDGFRISFQVRVRHA